MDDKRVPGHAGAILLVCSRCNRTGTPAEGDGERAGGCLLRAVSEAGVAPQVRVQPIACMSGCERAWVSDAEITWPAPPPASVRDTDHAPYR